MAAEAWVALVLGVVGIVGTVLGVAWVLSSQITKIMVSNTAQSREIAEVKLDVGKLNDLVSLVAVQKNEIASLQRDMQQNTKRTDDTFTRIFGILDVIRGAKTS